MWNILTEIWYNFLKMSVYVSFLFCLFFLFNIETEQRVQREKAKSYWTQQNSISLEGFESVYTKYFSASLILSSLYQSLLLLSYTFTSCFAAYISFLVFNLNMYLLDRLDSPSTLAHSKYGISQFSVCLDTENRLFPEKSASLN